MLKRNGFSDIFVNKSMIVHKRAARKISGRLAGIFIILYETLE